MEEKSLVICDSDVLIEFLDRSNKEVQARLLKIGFNHLCVSAISAGELLVGAQDKKHFQRIQKFISELIVIPVTKEITYAYLDLLSQYSLSHGLKIQDALIASTALVFDFEFYTFNQRDFRFIKGLRLLAK